MRIFLIFCSMFIINFCYAEENISIITEGSGISKRLAIQEALKIAVEDVAGITINTNTVIVNNKITGDAVKSYSGGYVKEYKILEEKYQNKLYYVKIKAIVIKGKKNIEKDNKNTFDINILKNINSSEKAFENIIKENLPKYKLMLNNSVIFSINDFKTINSEENLTLCSFILERKINKDAYYKVINELNTFLKNIKLDKSSGNYKLILKDNNTKTYYFTENEFIIFKNLLYDNQLYYNMNLLNENDKILDTLPLNKAEEIIKISNNSIEISPFDLKKENYEILFSTKILNETKNINIEINNKKNNTYFLGIEVENNNNGLKIISVLQNSSAKKAKLFYGDIITSIDNIKISTTQQLKDYLYNIKRMNLSLKIIRDNKTLNIEIYPERKNNNKGKYI